MSTTSSPQRRTPATPQRPLGNSQAPRPEQRARCARTLDDCLGLHPGPLARWGLSHPLLACVLL